jgi:hypothetical protein
MINIVMGHAKEVTMLKVKKRFMMSALLVALMGLALFLAFPSGAALAANPAGTGQPGQSCEDIGVRPGQAMSAPGSAFNPNGVAGTVYAGNQAVNSKNPNSVSQYDVACFQVSQH